MSNLIHPSATIHHTSVIDSGAVIDEDVKVWHWTHVSSNARIGKGSSLGQNVYIGGKVIIGGNVKIQNNVSVYESVVLEDDVFCGPSVVFTNVLNPRSKVSRKHEYRCTYVARGATLGANCTIICGLRIGEFAFIGAGAVVTCDVKPFALMVGVPARHVGWMSAHGDRIPLNPCGDGFWHCQSTGDKYFIDDGFLRRLPGEQSI